VPEVFDHDAARRALRTLTDEPAPPVATSLDQVLRRGRRRVFAQRAGAVAGVVAVVAAIGVAAVLLRPGDQGGGVEVATSSATPTTPPAPAGPMPGWRYLERSADCVNEGTANLPPPPDVALVPRGIVEPVFLNAIGAVTGHEPVVVSAEWKEYTPKENGPRGYVHSEIPVAGGTDDGNGQLHLEAYRYGGTPGQMADASVNVYGNCEPPARRVLGDGTVLQLYAVDDFHPEQPTQHLQIYRPDARMYVITTAGYSEADMVAVGGGASTPVGGRGKLPATREQLADIAERVVANLP
jgi:hypothetical protein